MSDWTKVVKEADIGTARLIVQLQMQDAATLTSCSADQQLQSDADLARKIFEDELSQIQGLFPGGTLGEKLMDKENDEEAAFGCAALNWKFDEYCDEVEREPTPPPPEIQFVKCVACTEQIDSINIVEAPCSHNYCRDCLGHLFRSAMKDETLYPPRCCKQPIPAGEASKVLPKDLASEFVNRREEFETKDKTYCARPQCSAFIRPYTINGNLARCPRCRQATCADCKNVWHDGDCSRDDGVEQFLATVDQNQWRKCPECKRVIELVRGCNHIT